MSGPTRRGARPGPHPRMPTSVPAAAGGGGRSLMSSLGDGLGERFDGVVLVGGLAGPRPKAPTDRPEVAPEPRGARRAWIGGDRDPLLVGRDLGDRLDRHVQASVARAGRGEDERVGPVVVPSEPNRLHGSEDA